MLKKLLHKNPIFRSDWETLPTEEITQLLSTNVKKGLSAQEAYQRSKIYGLNQLMVAKKTHWHTILLRQFTQDILIIILFVAAGISLAIGEITDASTIFAIIILNGLLGFTQEWKAEQAITALKKMLSPRCKVIRDGIEKMIDATRLVPGDIVLLEIGNRVPTDLRLIHTVNLKADESTLTGESESVSKSTEAVTSKTPLAEQTCMAWMGTNITNGRAYGVAVKTGMHTEFGRIAQLTQTVEEEQTHLQKKLAALGKQLGILAITVSILVAGIGWFTGKNLMTMFLTGISLAVAVVPEGLPTVVIITMALGIRTMARRRALLRRLQAAETLGATTVICTDKTGTLTKNEMTVTKIWLPSGIIDVTGVGYDPIGEFQVDQRIIDHTKHHDLLNLLEAGTLCNHAKISQDEHGWHQLGEPTEAALITAAYKAGIYPSEEISIISEFSFNSSRKRMTVIVPFQNQSIAYVKGAPEIILSRARYIQMNGDRRHLTDEDRKHFTEAYLKMAKNGLRTLALAKRELPNEIKLNEDDIENELTLLGVVGIIDPPRVEVPIALKVAHEAGIKTIMITGDAAETAFAVAKNIGMLADRVVTGKELDEMNNEQLSALLKEEIIFARTTPEHKLRIVTLLQQQGHVVGMTGDGVNDAPALKKADIGIAMNIRGTDVAKSASDMILTDDNFASIIGAIEEGRRQYNNLKKFIRFMLSSNMGELIAIFFNILLGGPLILLPAQILWINLITDGVAAVALGLEPAEKNIMKQKPNASFDAIFNKLSTVCVTLLGLYIGFSTLWLFHYYQNALAAQTIAFTGIIMIEKMNVLNFRTINQPMFTIGFFTNIWLLLAILMNISLQIGVVYLPFMQKLFHTVPLGWAEWKMILLLALPVFIVPELWKITFWAREKLAK